jgi:hypothetical protein
MCVYAFILSGSITINGQELGTETASEFGCYCSNIEAASDAEFLLMEIPMKHYVIRS